MVLPGMEPRLSRRRVWGGVGCCGVGVSNGAVHAHGQVFSVLHHSEANGPSASVHSASGWP